MQYTPIYTTIEKATFFLFLYICVCVRMMHLRLTFGSGVQQIEMIRNSPIFFGMLVETQAY